MECEKKYSLLFLGLIIPPFIWSELLNYYYLTPTSIISMFVVLWNYPWVATYLHTKPLYYGDLEKNKIANFTNNKKKEEIYLEIKNKYIFNFIIYLSILTSFIGAVLVDYFFYRTKDTSNIPEILGITGGILSMYTRLQTWTGKLLLYISIKLKEEEERRMVCFCSAASIKDVEPRNYSTDSSESESDRPLPKPTQVVEIKMETRNIEPSIDENSDSINK